MPDTVNAMRIRNAVKVAFFAIFLRSSSLRPAVIDRNTGMVPKGFVRVKNDVKASSANGSMFSKVVSMSCVFFNSCAKVIIFLDICCFLCGYFFVCDKVKCVLSAPL